MIKFKIFANSGEVDCGHMIMEEECSSLAWITFKLLVVLVIS